MQISHGFGPSAILQNSTGHRLGPSRLPVTHKRATFGPRTVVQCSAQSHKEQGKKLNLPVRPKLNAFLVAALPFFAALPAGANEIQHYLQLGAPGVAVVIGSLAFAAAAPSAGRKDLLTPNKTFDHVSLDEILQTEYHPCPGASPVPSKLEDLVEELREQTLTASEPVVVAAQPVLAFADGNGAVTAVNGRETDANVVEEHVLRGFPQAAREGAGHTLLTTFTDQQGRSGSLSQEAVASKLLLEKDIADHKVETTQGGDAAEKAKEIVSYVMEWTGLDARETKRVQSNVVPLHKSGDGPAKELLAVATASSGEPKGNGAPDGELATVAMVATVPKAAVAALTEEPGKSSARRQAEHKEKIDSLMSQVASFKAVAVTPAKAEEASASQQQEYDAKMNALKHSAAHKQQQEEARWNQQRASLESKMNQATKDRLQAVQPYRALATTNKPQGLAKLHPKVLIASLVESMLAVWRLVINTAKRFVGQDPPSPQVQGA